MSGTDNIIQLMPALKVNIFSLINANISVNEQPERFHWAHRRWPFYTYLHHVHVLDHGHFTDIVCALAI